MSRDALTHDVRRTLCDPRRVCEQLGLKGQHSGGYSLVQCPNPEHDDTTASCSVHRRDGTVAVKCHACGWGGDVLHLVAAVLGLDSRRDFRIVLAHAAELAGFREQADALRDGRDPVPLADRPTLEPEPERDYPPASEVAALWESAVAVTDDQEVSAMLEARGIAPALLATASLARVLRSDTHSSRVPSWARYKGHQAVSRSWLKTGHRLLLRAYDCTGSVRSVRAWRVVEGETPKRLPPSGYRASGLVVANALAVRWLQGARPARVVIVEGEPDMLARSVASPLEAVVGVGSGSWNDGFARRVPYGADVFVLTHLDAAGERYAEQIVKSLAGRANVRRWTTEAA